MTNIKANREPRKIAVVVDNESWILPWAEDLVERACKQGDNAYLVRKYDDIKSGWSAFYLSCVNITPPNILLLNERNLVVHASDLPKGRGFSPLTWSILDDENDIPVCLFEAKIELDSGPIIYRDYLAFEGHELINEMRLELGKKTVELCLRFIQEQTAPAGTPQTGEPTSLLPRRPKDSEIDPSKTIQSQFNQFRVADNESYPTFFTHSGHRYRLLIEKDDDIK